jgi:hypothetical protein
MNSLLLVSHSLHLLVEVVLASSFLLFVIRKLLRLVVEVSGDCFLKCVEFFNLCHFVPEKEFNVGRFVAFKIAEDVQELAKVLFFQLTFNLEELVLFKLTLDRLVVQFALFQNLLHLFEVGGLHLIGYDFIPAMGAVTAVINCSMFLLDLARKYALLHGGESRLVPRLKPGLVLQGLLQCRDGLSLVFKRIISGNFV